MGISELNPHSILDAYIFLTLLITTHISCLQKIAHHLQNEPLKNGPWELADRNMGL
jgi:hypothetical protein